MAKRTVQPIHPPPFNDKAAQQAFERQIKTIAKDWEKELGKTTATWNDKPTFKVKLQRRARLYAVVAEVSDMRWIWIDEGTKEHDIYPKRPTGVLAFPSIFKPKTRKRFLGSVKGYSGGATRFAKKVHHPGIEAREWTPMLSRRLTPKFMKTVDDAFRAYATGSGHGEE